MKKLFTLILALLPLLAWADDGHTLWLPTSTGTHDGAHIKFVAINGATTAKSGKLTETQQIIFDELHTYSEIPDITLVTSPMGYGTEVIGESAEGYAISIERTNDNASDSWHAYRATITASSDIGLLHGAYDLLRIQQTTAPQTVSKTEQPAFGLRMLNHWDNLDGSVERGYAGSSIWKWEQIYPSFIDEPLRQRLIIYARANASLGLNGVVLNNVNASPKMLSTEMLKKVKTVANLLRPYGLRVYLSVNFASPMALGATDTADPLDANVQKWWTKKAKEIYKLIPDFGGFLVKANSEGQPGPGDYHRTHADGANMLADALQPYGGTVIWRSFVYGANHKGEDRVKQAVSEFEPMDSLFHNNVILQSKNGPLDFQPREPYAPIFDRIKHTPQMAELQITQEYLGQSKHLVYLAPMWKEFFSYVNPQKLVGIAAVANTGDDPNWCGHPFSQANWYAFGRLAWNPELSASDIADEWLRQTFKRRSADKETFETFIDQSRDIMLTSREACVNYMMPLGLHHIFKFDHHMGPEPDGFKAEYPIEWCPVYYHNADSAGIGFDRTVATGSGATAQYSEPYARLYESLDNCPEEYLLWFHHVTWSHPMRSGRSLWQEMKYKYHEGVSAVERYQMLWQNPKMRAAIDDERWMMVNDLLKFQLQDAKLWEKTCLDYFGQFQNDEKK